MKVLPVISEKSLDLAKKGYYTFWVDPSWNKNKARKVIQDIFGVHVVNVRSILLKGEVKKTAKRKKRVTSPRKKVVVRLKDKEKIDLFDIKGKR